MVLSSIRSDLFLRGFLTVTILAAGWAFLPGRIDGQVAFVLYRAPKLAAVSIGVWCFLALFLACRRRRLDPLDLWATLRRPQVVLLALWLLWLAVSTLWAAVPANGLLELSLYLPLFMLIVLLATWMRRDPRVRPAIEHSLIAVAAVATVVAGVQSIVEPRWLSAINPLDEVGNPSLMGYKNPMALALGGQLLLLFGRIATARGRGRALLILCAVAELAYLAQLESRTSLAAVAAAGGGLLAAAAAWPPRHLSLRRLGAASIAAAILLALGVVAVPAARHKAASLLAYGADPARYLESDRGVYLRNTLNMVRHRPWGVGAGDWQTQYPVYRLHDRYRSFNDTHEVRRAHSDHVQILGESGWLGLALWLAFLGAVLGRLGRSYRRSRNLGDLCLLGQTVFWVAAMATDYVLDLPFHRLAFFLLVACAVAGPEIPPRSRLFQRGEERRSQFPVWASNAWIAATVGAAVLSSLVAVSALRLAYDGAVMTRLYLQALGSDGAARSGLLLRAASHGATLLGTSAHDKTRYKDWQVHADVFLRLGNRDAARQCALRALELHPYSPTTFRLLARIDTGARRDRWRQGHDHILDDATAGFGLPYPKVKAD